MSTYTFSIACSLLLMLISSILALYLAITFTLRIRAKSVSEKTNSFATCTTLNVTQISALAIFLTLFCCSLCMVILMISQSFADHIYTTEDSIAVAIHASFFVFLMLWYASSYMFMLARLVTTFKESVYAITKPVMYLNLLFIFLFLLSTATIYGLIVTEQADTTPKILLPIVILIYLVGLVHLGYAFNSRLFKLVLLQRQTIVANGERSLSDAQRNILKVIRKNTLLASFQAVAMFFTAAAYAIGLLLTDAEYIPFNTYPSSQAYIVVVDLMKATVFFVSSLSVFLGFHVNETGYVRLCNVCDTKCEAFYEGITHRKMNDHEDIVRVTSGSEDVMSTNSQSEDR